MPAALAFKRDTISGITDSKRAAFRDCARSLANIDERVYAECARDPLEPIIGAGERDARICIFGRDPGAREVHYATPFIGAGGQKVRRTLYEHLYGTAMSDFAASMAVGELFFWANTVPYKPLGNKAWPMAVKRAFHPLMVDVLLDCWRGADIIVLGREAFFWFGIGKTRDERARLDQFWQREKRYEASIDVLLTAGSAARSFTLYPLPHPSPLNATWYKHFPRLLTQRLEQLDARPENLGPVGSGGGQV
jgi:uracil-DNA glycosylase